MASALALRSATIALRVPFHDVDSAQVVWHGHYAKYFEIARSKLLDELGYGHARMRDSEWFWPVTRLDAKYIQPLRLDQTVSVRADLLEADIRLRCGYVIHDVTTGRRTTTGQTVQVAVRRATGLLCIGLPAEFRVCLT